jgi:hypothetical protein
MTGDGASNEFSQPVVDLAFAALDHGVDSVRGGGPLIPFVMVEIGSERTVLRFAAETIEDGLAQAVNGILQHRDDEGRRHALAYDGYLTLPSGERFDAIYVEAVEAGRADVMVLAQRYRPKRRLRAFETIGNPALLPADSAKLAP